MAPGFALPREVLVAVEGAEPSLRESSMKAASYALSLASAAGAGLVAVCVVQIPDYIEENVRGVLRGELVRKSEATLAEIGAMASEAKVKFGSEVLETSGGIAAAICNAADKKAADLIVLGTRANTSSATKAMLGSVAVGVVANASCPVLVVR